MRAELDYCVPLALPHSEFLSWDEEDQDKALAHLRYQASVCNGCGTRKDEWSEDRFAYVAQSDRCLGCEVLAQEKDNLPEDTKGIRLFLVPRAFATVDDAEGG